MQRSHTSTAGTDGPTAYTQGPVMTAHVPQQPSGAHPSDVQRFGCARGTAEYSHSAGLGSGPRWRRPSDVQRTALPRTAADAPHGDDESTLHVAMHSDTTYRGENVLNEPLLTVVRGQDRDAGRRVAQESHVLVHGNNVLGLCKVLHVHNTAPLSAKKASNADTQPMLPDRSTAAAATRRRHSNP